MEMWSEKENFEEILVNELKGIEHFINASEKEYLILSAYRK